jgi:hypothetical protein
MDTLSAKLYVGNLLYEITEQDLADLFSPYGAVTSAEIVRYKKSGRSKGFGFVQYADAAAADAALAALQDFDFRGRKLMLGKAKAKPPEDSAEAPPKSPAPKPEAAAPAKIASPVVSTAPVAAPVMPVAAPAPVPVHVSSEPAAPAAPVLHPTPVIDFKPNFTPIAPSESIEEEVAVAMNVEQIQDQVAEHAEELIADEIHPAQQIPVLADATGTYTAPEAVTATEREELSAYVSPEPPREEVAAAQAPLAYEPNPEPVAPPHELAGREDSPLTPTLVAVADEPQPAGPVSYEQPQAAPQQPEAPKQKSWSPFQSFGNIFNRDGRDGN